jgi:hypothetical protein
MADAMQGGIMALPPEMGGMEQPPQSYLTPEDEAVFEQIRQSVPKKEFSNEMLNAAEQVDPQTIMQLRAMVRSMQLPPDLVDLLQQMVDMLLNDPDRYQENRAKFLAEGVPEDLLPPEFDPEFFAALDMVLDDVSGPTPQGFAAGGMVMNPIAAGIASLGRNGDTMLAHITPQEARMLRRAGGSGSINPATGLPEFFKLFKSIGKAIKKTVKRVGDALSGIGKGIKKFVRSSIGRVITSIALGFLLGPAAAGFLGVSSAAGVAAISGFVGGAGSTLLAGGSVKDALRTGAIGGLTVGALSGISGGAGAFQSGSYTGPTTVSGQWQRFTDSLGSKAVPPADGLAPTTAQTPDVTQLDPRIGVDPNAVAAGSDDFVVSKPFVPTTEGATGYSTPSQEAVFSKYQSAVQPGPQSTVPTSIDDVIEQARLGRGPVAPASSPGVGLARPVAYTPPGQLSANMAPAQVSAAPSGGGGVMGLVNRGVQGAKDIYNQYLSPSGIQEAGAQQAQTKAFEAVNALPAGTSEGVKTAVFNRVYESNLPGMLATYGPLAAAGYGAAALMGGFTPQPSPKPNIPTSGAELYKQNPYLITPDVRVVSASTGQPYSRGYAQGGIADLPQGTKQYPRKTGPINGPGTGTSDSIPAMLSDGEFVFTAKAVRAMGKGSRRKGAKRMYALMKALEKRA